MKQNKIGVKNKLTNYLTTCGKKSLGEKILLKNLKELQKLSSKQTKKLIKLAIVLSIPTFKFRRTVEKKRKNRKKVSEIPAFIFSETARISMAIKFIVTTSKKRKSQRFYLKLKEEMLLNAQNKGKAVKVKNGLQKQVLVNKRFFLYFR